MERAFSHERGSGEKTHLGNQRLKLSPPLERLRGSYSPNPFSILGFWVWRNLRNLYCKARFLDNGCCCSCSGRLQFNGTVVNNSAFLASPGFFEEGIAVMECLDEKKEGVEEKENEGFGENEGEVETSGDLITVEKGRESSSSSDFLTSETTGHEEQSHSSSEESSSPLTLGWPVEKSEPQDCTSHCSGKEAEEKTCLDDKKLEKQGSSVSGITLFLTFVFSFLP